MKNILKIFLSEEIRKKLRRQIDARLRKLKEPRMIWGYMDSTGQFRPRTRISDTVYTYHPEKIKIGNNAFVWHYSILDGTGGLEIGEGTQVGAWVGIFTHSSHIAIRIYGLHYTEVPEQEKKGYKTGKVIIGKYVFIGAGAKIMPGVTIGDGALIAAGTVVKDKINAFEIVSGNPSKVVGDTRKMDQKYLADPQLAAWYQEWQEK